MRRGVYLATDGRKNPQRPCTDIVKVTYYPKGYIILKNLEGFGGFDLEGPEEHPDFLDDEENGRMVLATPLGQIVLEYASLDRQQDVMDALPMIEWERWKLDTEEEWQEVLEQLCGDMW